MLNWSQWNYSHPLSYTEEKILHLIHSACAINFCLATEKLPSISIALEAVLGSWMKKKTNASLCISWGLSKQHTAVYSLHSANGMGERIKKRKTTNKVELMGWGKKYLLRQKGKMKKTVIYTHTEIHMDL